MRDLLAEASEIKVRKTIAETVAALDAIAATGAAATTTMASRCA